MDAEELLTAMDKGGIEGEGDICRLEELHDVVLLTSILQLDFVLEIEGGLGVPIDVEIEEVAYLGIHAHLYVLIEGETGDAAQIGIALGVIAEVVHYLEGEVYASGWVDADIGYSQEAVDLLAYLAETGYAAQEAVVGGGVGCG